MLIVFAPDASEGPLAILRGWAECGLLDPFVWWPSSPSDEAQPTLISSDGERTAPIGTLLADVDAGDIQVVAYALGAPAPVQPPDVTSRFAQLRAVLPAERGPVLPALLMAPRDLDSRFDPSSLARFGPILVLSPEDRSDPTDASQLGPATFDAHVGHALALVGGAFADQDDDPPLRELATTWRNSPGSAITVRPFSRMLDLGYIVDHIGLEVLRPGRQWPNPDQKQFDRAPLSDPQMDFIVDGYFEEHKRVLDVTPVEPIKRYDPPKVGLWEAIKAVFRFVWDRLRRRPVDWLNSRIGSMYDSVASYVEDKGEGSGIRIRRWNDRDASESVGSFVDDLLQHRLVVNNGFVAGAWRDLRALPMSLVDGTPTPKWLDDSQLMSGGLRQVVADPKLLVPDPEQLPPAATDKKDPRACDPRTWDPVASSAFTVGVEDSEHGISLEAPAIFKWRGERSTTLLWRIGERIARNAAVAHEESVPPSADEWPDLEEGEQELALAKKRARRRFFLGWLIVTTATVGADTTLLFTDHPLWAKVGGWFLSIVIWLVLTGLLWRRTTRREVRSEQDALDTYIGLLNRLTTAMTRREDAVRLDRRYEEYLDWAEMIGWFLHHPFLPKSKRAPALPNDPAKSSLPAAFRVGIGLISDSRVNRLSEMARFHLFSPRWLTSYYESIEDSVMKGRLRDMGIDPDRSGVVVDDPAGDVGRDPTSPRRVLLGAVRRGVLRSVDTSPMSRQFVEFLGQQRVSEVAERVAPLDTAADAERRGITAAWTAAPDGLDDLVRKVSDSVVRVRTDSGSGSGVIVDSAGVVATARHVIEGADRVTVVVPHHGTIEATVTASDSGDLALLEIDVDQALPFVRLASDAPPAGTAIVHIGHQLALEGDPTVSHGLVASSRRTIDFGSGSVEVIQTSYRSAPGGSGGPVLDLAGQLVGINIAGEVPSITDDPYAQTMTFAVPSPDLAAMIDPASAGGSTSPSLRLVGADPEDPSLREADDFLGDLLNETARLHVLPSLFLNRSITEDPAEVVTTRITGSGKLSNQITLEECVENIGFLKPVRIWLHRCDSTRPLTCNGHRLLAPESGEAGGRRAGSLRPVFDE